MVSIQIINYFEFVEEHYNKRPLRFDEDKIIIARGKKLGIELMLMSRSHILPPIDQIPSLCLYNKKYGNERYNSHLRASLPNYKNIVDINEDEEVINMIYKFEEWVGHPYLKDMGLQIFLHE